MGDIRKISIGKDYPNGVMHYQRGKEVNLKGVVYIISDIITDATLLKFNKLGYNIYISNKDGKVLWKQIIDVPTVVEFNISFA